jgi:hypothetical protein
MKSSQHSTEHEHDHHGERHEEGDHIIDWHLSYINSVLLQGEAYINSLRELLRAEIVKIKSDSEFVETKLPGSHHHLQKLRLADRDLRILLDPLEDIGNRLKRTGRRNAERMI